MKGIICLSSQPWSSTPGRTQQLISRLRDTKILYFSPAPSLWDNTWKKPGRKVRPNVTAFTLPPALEYSEHLSPLFRMGQQRLARFIQEKVQRCRLRSPLLWTSHPTQVHLLDHLEYSGLVYDCDRMWEELPGAWEGALAHTADVVFAASPDLRDRLSPCSSNIALLPNGVNHTIFTGETGIQKRRLYPNLTGPVLGWAGTLHADLDLAPLVYAAKARPDWTFLLLGRQDPDNPWLSRLKKCSNVILEDSCPLMEVPQYLDRCDVLLNFLRSSHFYSDVVPSRIYEYLSTGKPIVSMLWPDQVEEFPDVVYGAYTQEELVRLCASALEEDSTWLLRRRQEYGQAAAWSARGAEVSRILTTAGLL